MEGYNPFSALNKLKGFHFILFNADLCLRILSQIRKKVANTFLGGPPRLLRYYIGRVIEIYYNTTKGGGLPDLLQYYKGEGGVSRDPKFVLRNIWTAPYGSAPENSRSLMSHWCG